jgi:phosphopantothenoylcysteine decarboxylase/phosphopantothenate--cysteine ligase
LDLVKVETSEQMAAAVQEALDRGPVAFALAVAAVADFRPAQRSSQKWPTAEHPELELKLVRTPKILDLIRAAAPQTTLVAFKASSHTDDAGLLEQARGYLETGRADWVAANSVVLPGLGFESERNRFLLVPARGSAVEVGPARKSELSSLLWDHWL